MRIINNISDIDQCKWDALFFTSPYSSCFQSLDFYYVSLNQDKQTPFLLVLENEGKYKAAIIAVLHSEKGWKQHFTSRAIAHGGPVFCLSSTEQEQIYFLTSVLDFFTKRAVFFEVRNYFDYSPLKTSFTSVGFSYVPWLNIEVSTTDILQVSKAMSSSRRRQIKASIKSGTLTREAYSPEDLTRFYSILEQLYKTKVKKPLPPLQHFIDLLDSGMGICQVVVSNEHIIGGVFCLKSEVNRTLYEYYICGQDKENARCHPSIMSMWAMLEYAQTHDYTTVDLMGAGQPDKESPVRRFKSKFGGKMVENGRYLYVFKSFIYKLGRLYISLR